VLKDYAGSRLTVGWSLPNPPETAAYDGMPRNAIATGEVDFVLPVDQMPELLLKYHEHTYLEAEVPAQGEQQYYVSAILSLLLARTGRNFRDYKRGTINRRVERRMSLNSIHDIGDYHTYLRDHADEAKALADDLLIGVTEFFRDPKAWASLAQHLLPLLTKTKKGGDPVRVWVPGCSTGEEAYSMVMVLAEILSRAHLTNDLIVFATDIDKKALEVARAGIYPAGIISSVSRERLERHFVREGDYYRVKKQVREMVLFAAQDLITDPPFSKLDLISCRNLLIYIEQDEQERILSLFHFALQEGGFLFLGKSESTGQRGRLFRPLSKKWRLFQRVDSGKTGPMVFPLSHARGQSPVTTPLTGGTANQQDHAQLVQKALLARYAPPAVLVGHDYRVLYFQGSVRDYLGPSTGEPTDDIIALAGEQLRSKLRGVLHEARAADGPISARGARVERGSDWITVDISVEPITVQHGEPLLLVSFHDQEVAARVPRAEAVTEDVVVQQLEGELKAAKDDLRSTIEQMGTANEELMTSNEEVVSMNEELQSTNEELETSRDELQSLNDELTTLNTQLEDKVQQLEVANNDLDNLLSSTKVATLFLDARFFIRRFTPASTDLMSLISSDIGRSVTDINWHFRDETLLEDARRVMLEGGLAQAELRTDAGKWFLRRLTLYRTEGFETQGVVLTFTDITERKLSELALRESELLRRRVSDALPMLISYVDSEMRFKFNNAAYSRWFNISVADIQGKPIWELLGRNAFEEMQPYLKRVLAGERLSMESDLPVKDGETRYVLTDFVPDTRNDGTVAGFFTLINDLSERRKTEEQIAYLNQELADKLDDQRTLLLATPMGIMVSHDPACGCVTINRAGALMLGVDEGSIPAPDGPESGKLPFRFLSGDSPIPSHDLPMRKTIMEDREVMGVECEVELANKSRITVLVDAAPLHDSGGGVRGYVTGFMNITESKRNEQNLNHVLQRLQLHMENTPLVMLEWGADTVIRYWNPAAERLFGWTRLEAVGNSLRELGIIHPDDSEKVGAAIAELIEGEVASNTSNNRNIDKDDGVHDCMWYNSVLRDKDGAVVSVFSYALDLTERTQMEAVLRKKSLLLEAEAKRKNDFLAMLGHELRNPLVPIRISAELLRLKGGDPETLEWVIRVLERQSGTLTRLVDDLLDMARIIRGAIRLDKMPVDMREIVRDAVNALEANAEDKKQEIRLELSEKPVPLMADAVRINQIITNLLVNAVKFTPIGGNIRVLVEVDGPEAMVQVEDNGMGIEPELIPEVFELFSQDKVPLHSGGLGLGLTLAKRLVELHSGTITAASGGERKGACFTIRLPLAQGVEVLLDNLNGEPVAHGPALAHRVLVVDDDPDVAESIAALCSSMGHVTICERDPSRVFDRVREFHPTVVLLDIGLPVIDGYTLASNLRKNKEYQGISIVAVSGYGQQEFIDRAREAGFDGYLLKPVTLGKMVEVLGHQVKVE